MSDTKSPQHNQGLVEWSKWITGISLFSASGCIGVLVTKGVGEKNMINIKLAIVFFLCSILIAWLIQLVVAMQQGSPEADSSTHNAVSLKKTSAGSVLRLLISVEIIMFILSCFFLARWVWKFPATKPVRSGDTASTEKAILVNENGSNTYLAFSSKVMLPLNRLYEIN